MPLGAIPTRDRTSHGLQPVGGPRGAAESRQPRPSAVNRYRDAIARLEGGPSSRRGLLADALAFDVCGSGVFFSKAIRLELTVVSL
jgi:hypothetical protein